MTSRERMVAAIRREDVDYVPCRISFNPLQEVSRRGYTWNFPWSLDATLEEQIAYQVGELGLDQELAAGARRVVIVSDLLTAPDIQAATAAAKARLNAE